jgi:hypothetical protein
VASRKKKGAKKSAPRGLLARQRQRAARHGVLEYARHLGRRKAAARLHTTVARLDQWLKSGFPPDRIAIAAGLRKPGGATTTIPETNLGKFLRRVGGQQASKATGIPRKELRDAVKKARARGQIAAVRFDRDRLEKLVKNIGEKAVAEFLKASPAALDRARKIPKTIATKRLDRFVRAYGVDHVAGYIGVTQRLLLNWLKKNVPRSREKDVNRAAGTTSDSGASSDDVLDAGIKRDYERRLAKAKKKVEAWNKKALPKQRISNATIERWVKQGLFEKNFSLAQRVAAAAKRPVKKQRPTPPPPPSRGPPPPTLFPEGRQPRLPRPPKIPPKTPIISEQLRERMATFLEARAEAFFNGRADPYKPLNSFGRFVRWIGQNRTGFRYYGKVQEFVHVTDLTEIGNRIIRAAREMWKMVDGEDSFMTIRLMFSARGTGNPFYPEAWTAHERDVEFFVRKTESIYEMNEIEWMVRSILSDAYEVDKEILLFFEHFEVVKSIPLPQENKPTEE